VGAVKMTKSNFKVVFDFLMNEIKAKQLIRWYDETWNSIQLKKQSILMKMLNDSIKINNDKTLNNDISTMI
jgi:hypothetical protein